MTPRVDKIWALYQDASPGERRWILERILEQPGEVQRVRAVLDAMAESGLAIEWVIRNKSRLWDKLAKVGK